VDFDLGFGSSAAAKPNFSSQTTAVLETPAQERTTIMSPQAMQSASLATPMDFDITGTNPGSPAMNYSGDNLDDTATLNMEDLVFDVTATHPRVPTIPAPEAPTANPKDDGVSFMLDFPTETKAKVTPARSLGLDEITLNLDQSGSSSASSGASSSQKDELWQEVATKLDLAKAYQEMGDVAGAREILDEVLRDGDAKQREGAQTLMQQLL
jgi:pilus assembly protein FimV